MVPTAAAALIVNVRLASTLTPDVESMVAVCPLVKADTARTPLPRPVFGVTENPVVKVVVAIETNVSFVASKAIARSKPENA